MDDATQWDVAGLELALSRAIRGEVHFDDGSRALYATDASNYRQTPIGVVYPCDAEDVAAAVAECRRFGAPILGRGGGTSLAGQCCNAAVVFDFTPHMHSLLAVDPERRAATVQPGLILDELRQAAEQHHLTFGPDPSTHNHCTLGGMIGNNSCGVHSVMSGRTSENVHTLEILTYDGLRLSVGRTSDPQLEALIGGGGRTAQIYRGLRDLRDRYAELIRTRFPKLPRRVSGFNLDQLLPENGFDVARSLVGTEGTCVMVLEADVRLIPSPPVRSLVVMGFETIYEAAEHVPELMRHKPMGLEAIDETLVSDMKKKGIHPRDLRLLPEGKNWLMLETGGETREESDERARELMRVAGAWIGPNAMKLVDDRQEEKIIWKIRESGLGATARVPGEADTWEGWEDSAVAPENLASYLRGLHGLYERFGYRGALYGHFGEGCVHTRINFDLLTAAGIEKFHRFLDEGTTLVTRHGGSISGEHGDGQSKAEFLHKMYGAELVQAFGEFKRLWDPDNRMNPHKVIDPYSPVENLRLGSHFNPQHPATHFQFPDDGGDIARAALRCVGVGECRRMDGGTMCPSYRVTRDEAQSTRGRAHLLFEMLQGRTLKDGWRDEAVKDSLDLCLSCKGCKGDCPMNVDVATYKAEFLSHFYQGRLRPRSAYSMGLIMRWARMAAVAPRLVNLAGRTPGIARAIKWLAGISAHRQLPSFAPQTFRSLFAKRPAQDPAGKAVLLWVDTFTDHFRPQVAMAAVEVLEAAGFAVQIPPAPLCCGRPLYDYGMLEAARDRLREILEALRPQIRQGIPMVGLEPSCMAVFRDEMGNLFPRDLDAARLKAQSFLLAELLAKFAPHFEFPKLNRKVIVQRHCHQQAVMPSDTYEAALEQLGLEVQPLESGCCGMAGSFGFEADHFEVSKKIGESVLLPAIRQATADTLIIADGFSCSEQILQATGRRPLHLAEVIQLGFARPEALPIRWRPRRLSIAVASAAALMVGVGALALANPKWLPVLW